MTKETNGQRQVHEESLSLAVCLAAETLRYASSAVRWA